MRGTVSYMCYPGTDIPIRRLSVSSLFLKRFFFSTSLQTSPAASSFSVLISILHFPHYNTTEEFISCIKQAERVVFFPPESSLSTLLHLSFPSLHPPPPPFFFWPQMTCDFSFPEHTARHCGKKQKNRGLMVGPCKEWIEMQGNRGRGRFEKTLFLLFSQSPPFSPEDERTEGGKERACRWERKRRDPCHPPDPRAAMRLCFTDPFCLHTSPEKNPNKMNELWRGVATHDEYCCVLVPLFTR